MGSCREGRRAATGTMDIGGTSSCNELVSSGPAWAQLLICHFHLVIGCFRVGPAFMDWGGSDSTHFMSGSSSDLW